MRESRRKNIINNAIWGWLRQLTNILLPFISRTVMIYKMGVDYTGVSSLFTSILQVLSLSELGFGSAIVYSMYKPIVDNDKEKICALYNLYKKIYKVVGLVILIIGLCITPFIPNLIEGSYPSDINIEIVYIGFLINTAISYLLFSYTSSIFSAYQHESVNNKISLLTCIFQNTLQIAAIIVFRSYYLYLAILILSTALNSVLSYIVSRKEYPEIVPYGTVDKDTKNEIKSNVLALLCHKVGGTILNSADNIVISAFLGLTMLAEYNNYYYIMNAAYMLINICFNGMTASIGNSILKENKNKNENDFYNVLFVNYFLTGLFSAILVGAYQDFIILWVGVKYLLPNFICILIVEYFFIHSIRKTILTYRDACGMWADNMFQPIVSGILNLIINIVLVQHINLYGVIISTLLCMIFIDIPWESKEFFNKQFNKKPFKYYKRIILYGSITVANIFIDGFMFNYIKLGSIINILVKTLTSVLIYILLFKIVFHNTKEYKNLAILINSFIKNKKRK